MDGPQAEVLEFPSCGQIVRREGGEGANPCPDVCVRVSRSVVSDSLRPHRPHFSQSENETFPTTRAQKGSLESFKWE